MKTYTKIIPFDEFEKRAKQQGKTAEQISSLWNRYINQQWEITEKELTNSSQSVTIKP